MNIWDLLKKYDCINVKIDSMEEMKEMLNLAIENNFDIPFEETLKRHQTKPNCNDFGEEAMRRWWREKDFSDVLNEVSITSERDIESIVSDICNTVINN